jgi:Fe/S biogenesis protein NfuA
VSGGDRSAPAVRFTPAAREQVARNRQVAGGPDLALRLEAARRGRASFDYQLTFVGLDEREAGDEVVVEGDFLVFVDPASAELVRGTTIDFDRGLARHGFAFDNPLARWDDPVADAVQEVLDGEINPRVGSHGGVVTLLAVRDDTAFLEMGGGCQGCGKAAETLRRGVEGLILRAVPEITRVVDTTDHEAGTQPFYAPGEDGETPLG